MTRHLKRLLPDVLDLQVGDLIFTRMNLPVFTHIAEVSGTWTNHVGMVYDAAPGAEIIIESTVPRVCKTPVNQHLARSENKQFAILRLKRGLSEAEKRKLTAESEKYIGLFYDLWFNLDSRRQYCSKMVYLIYLHALKTKIGKVQTPRELFDLNPDGPLWLFRLWFMGMIPWKRRMVTPGSILKDPAFDVIYDTHQS